MKFLIFRVLSAICMPLLLILLGFALGEHINLIKLIPYLLLFYLALASCAATSWKELQRPHQRKSFSRYRRKEESGFKYIYIYDDGSARELSTKEQEMLTVRYHGGDAGRPYVKSRYEDLDGWGRLSGFMSRRQLPPEISIGSVPENEKDFYSPEPKSY